MAIDFMSREVLLTIGAVILFVVAVYLYIQYKKCEKKSEPAKVSDLSGIAEMTSVEFKPDRFGAVPADILPKQANEKQTILTAETKIGTEEIKTEELKLEEELPAKVSDLAGIAEMKSVEINPDRFGAVPGDILLKQVEEKEEFKTEEELPEVEEKKDAAKKPEKKQPGEERAAPKKKTGKKKKRPQAPEIQDKGSGTAIEPAGTGKKKTVRKPRKKAEPEKGKSLF